MQPGPRIPDGLPTADSDSLQHSLHVANYIRERITEAGGAISFGEFMHHALYAPGLGYYNAGARKIGADGDFVTAPEISPLFGRVIAAQCAPVLNSLGNGAVLELGAGSGALAVAVLRKLVELDALPDRYLILDVSPDLIDRQRRQLSQELPELVSRVEWVDALPDTFDGVILANEVADALPVERFERRDDAILQQHVRAEGDTFVPEYRPANEALVSRLSNIEGALGRRLDSGFRSEVSLGLRTWGRDLAERLSTGLILVFDYGLSRAEYYAQSRASGWLRCHFRHHVHAQPLIYPGIQDITCWVDFSEIAEAGREAGADVIGFVTQAMFLLNGGLDNEFASYAELSERDQFELARQVKLLTMPGEMGENFKCLAMSKGDVPALSSFDNGNRVRAL